ncbi:M15 family metallopeptidase [Candidatus Nomurabacteria bacterium]|nr:M15 family metallopeptidase [Candidatus Nomurabacteria bacterium]
MRDFHIKYQQIITIVLLIISLLGLWQFFDLSSKNKDKADQITQLKNDLASTTESLASVQNDNTNLIEALDTEKRRNDDFENQISDIASTVGVLDKLSKTDPELLQKYSKVYFLNENYVPARLTRIDEDFVYDQNRLYQIHADIWSHLKNMLKDAKDDNINLLVVSAYRSFFEQASLKNSYTVTYGSGANTFSADQGYSEHQLGTTVDLSTKELGSGYTQIESTEAYQWLLDNAYKYGFILSYPKGNDYYVFEPWHWRFVGTDLAKDLHRKDKDFYDLTQRELDEYLVNFFD